MKRFITFVFALSVVLFLSGVTAYAQGKGQGRGPGAGLGQSRAPGANRDHGNARSDDHGEHVKTEKSEKDHEAKLEKKDEKFEERIDRNPALKAKIESLLPAGMNLKTAAMGFKNQGQFIAALHVSRNLSIPFDQLKAKMTGPNAVSLGKAVQALKPNMTEKQIHTETENAEKQGKETQKTKAIT